MQDPSSSSTVPSSSSQQETAAHGFSAEDLVKLGRVGAVAPSPCGRWLAVEVARLDPSGGKYRTDLWRVSVEGGAEPVRLTRGPATNSSPAFRDDGSLLFLSNRAVEEGDSSGKPKTQVWCLPAGGGEAIPLTDEPLGVSSFQVAEAGDRLLVLTSLWPGVALDQQRKHQEERSKHGPSALHYKAMPVRRWDRWLPQTVPHLVAFRSDGTERQDLTPDGAPQWEGAEWDLSRDGSRVVITSMNPVRDDDRVYDQHLVIVDVDSGAQRRLGELDYVMFFTPKWSPDGRTIACSHSKRFPDRCIEYVLWCFDAESGEGRSLASSWDRWGAPVAWSADSDVLYATADDQGTKPIFAIDMATETVTQITAGGGCHGSIHVVPGQRQLVGVRHKFHHPPEPFVVTAEADAMPSLLACLSGLSPDEGDGLIAMESFTVEAEDGAPVQSFLFKPKGVDVGDGPLPLLLWIHGGPRAQHVDGWHWRWNAMVAAQRGFAVACPNPRGSTGFGHEFLAGIWGNQWGAACYTDLMRVTDALVARDDIDETKTAAMGGSFGGYMCNWIGANTDRFNCLVTHASLFALSHFFGTTDLPGWASMEMQCTPYSDVDAYDRYSPHKHMANWKTPTLIIHGERDYRVPISEALFLFESLQMHGVPSELLVFPDENHWVLKPKNICVWYEQALGFIEAHVADNATAEGEVP